MMLTRYNNGIDTPVRRLMDTFMSEPFLADLISREREGTDNLALDVSETEHETIVRASLPGFRKDEVHVEFHEGVLNIRAEHSTDERREGENYLRRERTTETLSRSLRLPKVDRDGEIKAELTDGVLTLWLPHSEASRPRQISLK